MIPSNVFLYKPDAELPDLSAYLNQTIEVRIEKKYVSRDNPNVIKRKIWGSENYTSHSDLVCILLHFTKFNIDELNHKNREGVNLFLTVGKRTRMFIEQRRPTTAWKKRGWSRASSTRPTSSKATR